MEYDNKTILITGLIIIAGLCVILGVKEEVALAITSGLVGYLSKDRIQVPEDNNVTGEPEKVNVDVGEDGA